MTQCELLNSCQVSHTIIGASKNVKSRLSRNSMKFNVVARFRKTVPTVKSVSSSEIYKIFEFSTKITFFLFFRNLDFIGFHRLYAVESNGLLEDKIWSKNHLISKP